jgi:hypothetical protein
MWSTEFLNEATALLPTLSHKNILTNVNVRERLANRGWGCGLVWSGGVGVRSWQLRVFCI